MCALLEHSARVNARNDPDGMPAFDAAAEWCDGYIVDRLIKAGANVNAETRQGRKKGRYHEKAPAVCRIAKPSKSCWSIHWAAINARDDNDGNSPLHVASLTIKNRNMSLGLVDYLLIAGADETASNNHGNTPASHLPASHLVLLDRDGGLQRVLREQFRGTRAPADRADRAWSRRGIVAGMPWLPRQGEEGAAEEPKF